MKIVSIRSSQNENLLEKIKEEFKCHIPLSLTDNDANRIHHQPDVVIEKISQMKPSSVNEIILNKETKPNIIINTSPNTNDEQIKPNDDRYKESLIIQEGRQISKERRKRFLIMKQSDIQVIEPKKLACERDIKQFNKLKDTIRCACGILYERVKKIDHMKTCPKRPPGHKYGCASCSFKHPDLKEVEEHIEHNHKSTTSSTK